MSVLELVANANARGPTSGFTDVLDDDDNLPEGFDRLSARLFKPLKVGAFTLSHRVVHAALGRSRSLKGRESPLGALYFAQRITPGGLIISQATAVTASYLLSPYQVGLQRQDQIDALAKLVNTVHEGGGIWFQQLYHAGRASSPALVKLGLDRLGLPEPEYGYRTYTASSVAESGINTHSGEPFGVPRALTIPEIEELTKDFKTTAINAVKAGADGIEVLAGNGFLLDQFLHDNINQRTDIYGGSVENRSRFPLEVVDAVADIVGYQRIGVRLSPFSK
ncbi:12-oxophytodienoate reductase [Cadophora sp. MPI-SDFR-AT-0126]|nr:12-oxophytodienoate reductase [Leotiomycetes sp. MPI-SDFR-AT-0126]